MRNVFDSEIEDNLKQVKTKQAEQQRPGRTAERGKEKRLRKPGGKKGRRSERAVKFKKRLLSGLRGGHTERRLWTRSKVKT